jgi:hypothetical protein
MAKELDLGKDLYNEETEVRSNIESAGVAGQVPLSRHLANPLHGIPRQELERNVTEFAQEKGLTEHLTDLKKGALVAQSPAGFEELDCLDDEDRAVIRHEYAHKWSHPRTLYVTIFLCSVGAATQGWDQVSLPWLEGNFSLF